MTEHYALCTKCDHGWVPRHPPEEIDQPRCSDCGATGDSVQFWPTGEVADAMQRSQQDPEVVREAKRERRWQKVRQRLREFLDRLEGTAPSGVDEIVAREVRGPYWEIDTLLSEINDRGPQISLEELNSVSDRLDELEAEIDDVAPSLDIVDDLHSRKEELETKIDELKSEHETLAPAVRKKKQDYESYSERLEDIEDIVQAYKMGFEDGRYEFLTTIPCTQCRKPIEMIPGGELHSIAIQVLQDRGVRHPDCAQNGLTTPEGVSRP